MPMASAHRDSRGRGKRHDTCRAPDAVPELQAVAIYNTSAAEARFRSCQASDAQHSTTETLALYSMQVCYSLVRKHEFARSSQPHGRGVEKFDFIMRVNVAVLLSFVEFRSADRLAVASFGMPREPGVGVVGVGGGES